MYFTMNVAPYGYILIFIVYNIDIMTLFDYGKQYTESWKVNVVNFIIKYSFLHLKTFVDNPRTSTS